MEFFKKKTKIPFMRQYKWAIVFSTFIFTASILSFFINGLNLGIDFTGGTQAEISFPKAVNINSIRLQLVKQGFREALLQAYNTHDISVRIGIALQKKTQQEQLKQKIMKALPGSFIRESNYIGPQIGKTLIANGVLAVIVSLIVIMIYIALRFEYRFSISAAIALIHDPVVILGIFSFFHLEFNLIVLAGLLTVIGYSLNDTIVVYDRVRENFRKVCKGGTPTSIVDLSINQTLSRTIITSGLTLLVVIGLFLFGGEMIHGFALVLIIGIVVGTYSSIYIASALAVTLGLNRGNLVPQREFLEE